MPKSVTYVVGICVTHVPESTSLALHHLQSGCAAEIRWLCRICAVTFRVGGIDRQMFRGEVRVTSHHLLGLPPRELLKREERRSTLHVPGGPGVAKVVPAEVSYTRSRERLYQAAVLTCFMGCPSYVNTRVGCLPCCARRTCIAVSLSGTAIARLAFAWSG